VLEDVEDRVGDDRGTTRRDRRRCYIVVMLARGEGCTRGLYARDVGSSSSAEWRGSHAATSQRLGRGRVGPGSQSNAASAARESI
jgi:hypothetical protein